ncbi:protein of unknown function DUF218 [Rippkaea orientalis PCC 8801]|uniref:DUF218 domain-containing protein n=1 Tax=Rippkaea orientalis (strain PCC 8801 / RF-1) TaxID=41431 RepID=B7JY31_RIPO1|nr:YdcF family protein [Rippkaea orientalis]ACK65995.1 protein of unknown function DUF218 [Rippkaea orientalis PCC 8801]
MLLKIHSPKHNRQIFGFPRVKLRILPLIPVVGIAAWLGYKQVQSYRVKPEAIFVLGGHEERERFAAQLAKDHPTLPIWVSSGSPKGYAKRIFAKAGVERDRLHLDYQAKDTVTNFTTLVNEFKAQGIDSVYLVTSKNHLPRARVIGEIIFGSQGIVIKPMAVECDRPPEPWEKILRDGARSLLWVATGKTGETLIDPKSL